MSSSNSSSNSSGRPSVAGGGGGGVAGGGGGVVDTAGATDEFAADAAGVGFAVGAADVVAVTSLKRKNKTL